MRILLTSHEPLDAALSGRAAEACARGLVAGGHEARLLCVDDEPSEERETFMRRILCHAVDARAPLRFAPPSFQSRAGGLRFTQMTDRQLSDYRDVLREVLDREIDLYDPCIVHVQNVWVFGHLALEAGVPYVLSAHADEFETVAADARYRRYMQEAAENACRILTHDDVAHEGVTSMVGDLEGRVMRFPLPGGDELQRGRWWETLPGLYRAALVERFGKLPEACDR